MWMGQDDAAARKLGPIYDAIEHKQYKMAHKLAKQAQQKFPKSLALKALYAVTLERLGKVDEALEAGRQTCEVMKKSVALLDESVVNTLTIVFKAARKLGELQGVLEDIAASAQGSEGIRAHRSLFNACARTFSFLKMQQVAMKLYKRTGDHKYVFWAVTSIYLQCASTSQLHMLPLAETMCRKTQKEKGLASLATYGPDALLIYVEVLFSQNKYREALELLREIKKGGGNGEGQGTKTRLLQSQLNMLEATLCICCGDLDAAVDLLETHIKANPEDWHASKVLMEILLPSGNKGTSVSIADFLPTLMNKVISINPLDKAPEFIGRCGEEKSLLYEGGKERVEGLIQVLEGHLKDDKRKARALYLMKLDFLCRQANFSAKDQGKNSQAYLSLQEGLVGTLVGFWDEAGSNISFTNDILDFVPSLSPDSASTLLREVSEKKSVLSAKLYSELEKRSDGDQEVSAYPNTVKKVFCKVLSALEIGFLLKGGVEDSGLGEAMTLFEKCIPLYHGYDERENTIVDPLVVLISRQVWWESKKGSGNMKRVMHCIMKMLAHFQTGVRISPFNSNMLLSLALLYGHLGVSDLCSECFWKLDIKYIQLETIGGHMLLPYLTSAGNEREASKFCDKLVNFQEDHDRNAGDTFVMTFDQGTYLESIDFNGLRSRLSNSLVRYSVSVERSIVRILQKGVQGLTQLETILEQECRELKTLIEGSPLLEGCDKLHHNMDLSVRPEWAPPQGNGTSAPHGVLTWWDSLKEGNGESSSQSIGNCWWEKVNAANSLTSENACAYRAEYRKSVVARYAQVQAFGCILSTERSGLELHVETMATNLGLALGEGFADLSQLLVERLPEGTAERKLQVLSLSVFVVTSLFFALGGDGGNIAKFEEGLEILGKNFEHVLETVFAPKGVLPSPSEVFFGGAGVLTVSTYVREVVSWSSLLFTKWGDVIQEMKKKQRKEKRKGLSKEAGQGGLADVKAVQGFIETFKTSHIGLKEKIQSACLHSAGELTTMWWQSFGAEEGEGEKVFLSYDARDKTEREGILKNVAEGQLATLKVALDRMNKFMNLLK